MCFAPPLNLYLYSQVITLPDRISRNIRCKQCKCEFNTDDIFSKRAAPAEPAKSEFEFIDDVTTEDAAVTDSDEDQSVEVSESDVETTEDAGTDLPDQDPLSDFYSSDEESRPVMPTEPPILPPPQHAKAPRAVVLEVKGMMCNNYCTPTVTKALQAVPGVGSAVVSLVPPHATVNFEEPASLAALTTAIAEAGYSVSGVVSDSSATTELQKSSCSVGEFAASSKPGAGGSEQKQSSSSFKTVVLMVKGMMCNNYCTPTVTKALLAVRGVLTAQVTLEPPQASVVCEVSVSQDMLTAAIVAAGYTVVSEAVSTCSDSVSEVFNTSGFASASDSASAPAADVSGVSGGRVVRLQDILSDTKGKLSETLRLLQAAEQANPADPDACAACVKAGIPFIVYVYNSQLPQQAQAHHVILFFHHSKTDNISRLGWSMQGFPIEFVIHRSVPVGKKVQVCKGKQKRVFELPPASSADVDTCCSICVENMILNLEAPSPALRTLFLSGFHRLMTTTGKKFAT